MLRMYSGGVVLLTLAMLIGAPILSRADGEIEVGRPAPEFSAPDETGKVHTLAEFRGRTLILAFYPKDFTGG